MTEPLLDILVELESRVWEALRRGDAAEDERLLAADFVGLYPTGYADRNDHVGQLVGGPTVAEFQLHDVRLIALGPDDALLCYRAHYRRPGGGTRSMWVSSLWSRREGNRREGNWVNVFSQDTPVAAAGDEALP